MFFNADHVIFIVEYYIFDLDLTDRQDCFSQFEVKR